MKKIFVFLFLIFCCCNVFGKTQASKVLKDKHNHTGDLKEISREEKIQIVKSLKLNDYYLLTDGKNIKVKLTTIYRQFVDCECKEVEKHFEILEYTDGPVSLDEPFSLKEFFGFLYIFFGSFLLIFFFGLVSSKNHKPWVIALSVNLIIFLSISLAFFLI